MRERHAAVVPDCLVQPRVQALRRAVRARQQPHLDQDGVETGEHYPPRGAATATSGPSQPLLLEHAPAVDHRGFLQEVRPNTELWQVALNPQLGLMEGPDAQKVPSEPVELDPDLKPEPEVAYCLT